MSSIDEVKAVLGELKNVSPIGFAIGLHLEYTTSRYIFQTYPKAWMDEYSRRGFILADPTVRWGVENLGWARWSDLADLDEAGILPAAAEFGLTYGVSIAVESSGTRSLGSFAATDRDFSEAEIERLSADLVRLHDLTSDIEMDSPFDTELRRMAASLS
ncbi:MAG: autoinducer binding domain-containing protein [Paracoccaceae bacterium]|nr:autoinducer binding domain-containing protein [Paracoccaceae bacterium]